MAVLNIDMSSIYSHIAMFGTFSILLWFPLILVVTLMTPRKLLTKYFKEPHFNSGELIVFGSFPGFFMRTAVFCRFYLTPKAVKGRQMEGFFEDSPKWYRISVTCLILGCLLNGLIAFASMGIVLLAG